MRRLYSHFGKHPPQGRFGAVGQIGHLLRAFAQHAPHLSGGKVAEIEQMQDPAVVRGNLPQSGMDSPAFLVPDQCRIQLGIGGGHLPGHLFQGKNLPLPAQIIACAVAPCGIEVSPQIVIQ